MLNQFNACKGELLELARRQVRLLRWSCAIADIISVGRLWDETEPFAL